MVGNVTQDQVKAALKIMMEVTKIIAEEKRIPSGILYSILCDKMSLDAYESMIRQIIRTGFVKLENHELIWTGPDL